MSAVLVHKAVEPDALSVKGRKRLAAMLTDDEYIVQPKLDGVYCQILFDPVFKKWLAYSRTGEHLHSVGPEILAQFSERNEEERYIGELWLPNTPHSDINGMARKKSVQSLELHLFDVIDPFPNSYSWRYEYLKQQWFGRGIEVVKSIPVQSNGHSPEDVLDYLYELAAKIKAKPSAYDGLVLKDANAIFVPGNGKDGGAIKIKPRASGDFLVVGTSPGIGNREGGIGALVVALGGGKTCEVGTGLNMADVHDRGEAYFIGKIVEVEYLAITKDGRLREPVYKSVRFDKAEPDVLACNVPNSD
jgi:ATP-dependent DNA ligase